MGLTPWLTGAHMVLEAQQEGYASRQCTWHSGISGGLVSEAGALPHCHQATLTGALVSLNNTCIMARLNENCAFVGRRRNFREIGTGS